MASLKLEWTDVMNHNQNRGVWKEQKQCLWPGDLRKMGRKSSMEQKNRESATVLMNVMYYCMIQLYISSYCIFDTAYMIQLG